MGWGTDVTVGSDNDGQANAWCRQGRRKRGNLMLKIEEDERLHLRAGTEVRPGMDTRAAAQLWNRMVGGRRSGRVEDGEEGVGGDWLRVMVGDP